MFEAIKKVYYENPAALIQVRFLLFYFINFLLNVIVYFNRFFLPFPLLKFLLPQLKVKLVLVISDGTLLVLDQRMKPS